MSSPDPLYDRATLTLRASRSCPYCRGSGSFRERHGEFYEYLECDCAFRDIREGSAEELAVEQGRYEILPDL